MPQPKTQEQLDEENYLDLKRTEITLRHRIAIRAEKNELYKDMLALKKAGTILSIEGVDV